MKEGCFFTVYPQIFDGDQKENGTKCRENTLDSCSTAQITQPLCHNHITQSQRLSEVKSKQAHTHRHTSTDTHTVPGSICLWMSASAHILPHDVTTYQCFCKHMS